MQKICKYLCRIPLVILCIFFLISCTGLFEKGPAHSSKASLDYPKTPLKNPAVVAYVNTLANTLASHEAPDRIGFQKIEVRVLETSRMQGSSAFYSPRIDITRGMLNALVNEAELAALLSHEIGHKVLHKKQTFTARNYDTKDIEYADWSQAREKEADEYGVMLAYKAGYDPYALVDYFDRLSQFQKGGIFAWLNETTATHKDFRNRARDLKKFLAKSKLEPGHGLKKSSEYSKALASIRSISTSDTINEIVPGGPNAAIARLTEIESELASHKRDGTPLSAERFIEIMDELSGLTKFYGIEPHGNFMKEILSQDSPLWDKEALAKKISDILLAMSGIGAGFMPMVGDAIDLHEFLTGEDYFTQTKLSFGERVLSAAGLLAGSGTGWRKVADGIDKTLDDARLAKKLGRSEIADARHALDEAEEIGDTSQRWGKLSADELNAQPKPKNWEAPYKPGTRVIYYEPKGEERYFRMHGKDNQEGVWLMRSDPRRLAAKERLEWYALPDNYNVVSEAIASAGIKMRISVAGPNRFGPGGGLQWEIYKGDLDKVVFNRLEEIK